MTTHLFEKYLQQQCTPEEQTEVESWLLQCMPEDLDKVLMPIWNDQQGAIMPEALESRLVKQIPPLGGKKKHLSSIKWWHAAAAAFVVGMFFLANHQRMATTKTSLPLTVNSMPQKNATPERVFNNAGENIQHLSLPDGSTVALYPHASIRYAAAYNIKDRHIILTGKALFSVAKDKSRPFTVYARALATTALGTRFVVDASSLSSVQVKLYEGRVIVRSPKKQQVLMPGDSLLYSDLQGSLLLKRSDRNHRRLSNEPARVDTLHFLQTPLDEVFVTLAKEYGTIIQFDKGDLKGMNFTGEVSTATSSAKVIRLIAEMNGLHCRNSSKGYTIGDK